MSWKAKIEIGNFGIYTQAAGLLSFTYHKEEFDKDNKYIELKVFCLHLFPRKGHRHWGYFEEWYDGPHPMFGIGPIALFCWEWYSRKERWWLFRKVFRKRPK